MEAEQCPFDTERAFRNIPDHTLPTHHQYVKEIGEGGEGLVSLWRRKVDNGLVAVKLVRRTSSKVMSDEARALGLIGSHPRIINATSLFLEAPTPKFDTLMLEYCSGGDLHDLHDRIVCKEGRSVPEGFLWHLFLQLTEALAFLHEGVGASPPNQNPDPANWPVIVHQDIKLENIFLTKALRYDMQSGTWPDVKLADFGYAVSPDRKLLPTASGKTSGGTYDWIPPQCTESGISRADIGKPSVDIWALGSVIHALVHGDPPLIDEKQAWCRQHPSWCDMNQREAYRIIPKRKIIPVDKYVPGSYQATYSRKLNQSMMQCLNHNYHLWPTAAKILEDNGAKISGYICKLGNSEPSRSADLINLSVGAVRLTYTQMPRKMSNTKQTASHNLESQNSSSLSIVKRPRGKKGKKKRGRVDGSDFGKEGKRIFRRIGCIESEGQVGRFLLSQLAMLSLIIRSFSLAHAYPTVGFVKICFDACNGVCIVFPHGIPGL